MPVEETDRAHGRLTGPSIQVRMLGTMAVRRHGIDLALPASRKVRALFAYLALAPRPVPRSQLCELLWDIPNDPRGELRWCLSKLRGIVDDDSHQRVRSRDDTVALDLSDCFVDAIEISRATAGGVEAIDPQRQRALALLFGGDFLEGLEVARSPAFDGWLIAQRRRFRSCHTALLEQLAGSATDDEKFGYLEKWLQLAPFDRHVHELLLAALALQGRIREGEEHLAATLRLFEAEGIDCRRIRETWRAARAQAAASPQAEAEDSPHGETGDSAPHEPRIVLVEAQGRPDDMLAVAPRRASLAVMPFAELSAAAGGRGSLADGLAHDVITRLAKLRSMFVIAQGTVFALHERGVGPEEAARMLNVDYLVSGSVRRQGKRLAVMVELTETRSARIVWAEIFNPAPDDALQVLDEIGNSIVSSVASEIETIERNRAILRPPNSLDAWEAHHRGLWHMYRFNHEDNERARHFFETAVRLDPTFARAYAGLSFTHFQNAFQAWTEREPEIERAYEAAAQSLMVDDRDPAAHWAMGRAQWLRGRHNASVVELQQSIDLSPNFAQGHYTLAFVLSQAGDPEVAISSSDYSRRLSPFDPLLFAMLGARALALVRLGRFEEAADWAVKAAARPNAHPHIHAIAAFSLALADRLDEAHDQAAAIHRKIPHYTVADFLCAFRLEPLGASLFHRGAQRIGMG